MSSAAWVGGERWWVCPGGWSFDEPPPVLGCSSGPPHQQLGSTTGRVSRLRPEEASYMACIAVVLPSPGEMRWLERSDSTWRAIGRAVVQAFVYERYGP